MKRFRFIAAFAIFCIGLYALVNYLPAELLEPINDDTARTVGLCLNALGVASVSVMGDVITDGNLTFQIISECTPIFATGLFIGFIAFYPSTIRQKAIGLVIGLPALYLGNVVRLVTIFGISRLDRSYFELLHVYLGQVFTIVLIISVCVVWLRWRMLEAARQRIPTKVLVIMARFVLISCGLFIIWNKVQFGYVKFLDRIVRFGFSLFDYRITFIPRTVLYYETFGIVTFIALMVALQSMSGTARIKGLAVGLPILFLLHLFHRIANALAGGLNVTFVIPIDLTLLTIGQYLLPVLPLVYMLHRQSPK